MKIQSLKILFVLMTVLCVVSFFAAGFAEEPAAGSDPAGIVEPSLSNEMNPVSDLTMLQQYSKLQTITITSDQLESLEPLTQYGELKTIILDHCNAVDLEPLSRCGALQSLTILGGSGWDLSPVASMQTLTSLTLSSLGEINLSEACKAPLLATLTVDSCKADFENIMTDTSLASLSFKGMDLTDSAPLFSSAAGTLTSLTLTDCIVNEEICTAIGACVKIAELIISNVEGISFLSVDDSSLTTLIVDHCIAMDGFSNLINGAQMTLTTAKITNCTMGIHFNGSLTTMQKLEELTLQNVTMLAFPFQGTLSSLTTLIIEQTDLTNAATLIRAASSVLTSLTLTDCTVNEEFCTAIGASEKLTELIVSNVEGVSFPDGSANDTSLTTLIVDQGPLFGFGNLINGAQMTLTSVRFTDCTTGKGFNGSLIGMQKLKELTLQNITGLEFPFVGSLPSLSALIIEQTDLKNAAPLLLSAAGALTSLTITDCTANADFGGAIGACGKLKELIIHNAEGLGFPDGCANKALATLIVDQTNMEGFSPLVAGAHMALTSVEITDCSMGQDVCSSLTVCSKLSELTLRNAKRFKFLFKGSNPLLSTMTIEQTDMSDGAPWIQAAAKALKSLTITDSYLGEEFCSALGTCGKLASLSLQNVKGLEIPDDYANKLLTTLSISQADSKSSITPLIEKVAKTLVSLTIADSSVDGAFCTALGACGKLKELHIVRVEGLSFPEGCANKVLANLTVDDCDMRGCAPLFTGAYKILASIIITNSIVNEDVCSAIGACTKIKTFIAQDVRDLDIQMILSLWAAKPKS